MDLKEESAKLQADFAKDAVEGLMTGCLSSSENKFVFDYILMG
jgi:hypothetical protein